MMMEVVMMDLSTLPPLGQGEVYNWERPNFAETIEFILEERD
jgi:hypothetical protein